MPFLIGILGVLMVMFLVIGVIAYIAFYAAIIAGGLWLAWMVIAVIYEVWADRRDQHAQRAELRTKRGWESTLRQMTPADAWRHARGDDIARPPAELGSGFAARVRDAQRRNRDVHELLENFLTVHRAGARTADRRTRRDRGARRERPRTPRPQPLTRAGSPVTATDGSFAR